MSLLHHSFAQVLLSAAQRQPGPFRIQLRLKGHLPQGLQEWCKVRPQEGGGQPEWEWAAHLWLEDATGEYTLFLMLSSAQNKIGSNSLLRGCCVCVCGGWGGGENERVAVCQALRVCERISQVHHGPH
jgi:hypothetical protein